MPKTYHRVTEKSVKAKQSFNLVQVISVSCCSLTGRSPYLSLLFKERKRIVNTGGPGDKGKYFCHKEKLERERRTHRVKLSLEYDECYKANNNEYWTKTQIS